MEELAAEYWGDVAFARLDLDKNPDARDLWGVTVLPTLVITKHALEVSRIEGAASSTRLAKQLAPFAASPEERSKREGRASPPGAKGE
jgi:thioredoxin 1